MLSDGLGIHPLFILTKNCSDWSKHAKMTVAVQLDYALMNKVNIYVMYFV